MIINNKQYELIKHKYTVEEVRQKAFFASMGVSYPCHYSNEELVLEMRLIADKKSSLPKMERDQVEGMFHSKFKEVIHGSN